MTNLAKHFTCYSGLIGVALFLFGLYNQTELKYVNEQNARLASSAATERLVESNNQAIIARDAQLARVNAQLDTEQNNAKTVTTQIALLNNLLNLPKPVTQNPRPNPSTGSVVQSEADAPLVIPVQDVPALLSRQITCTKCENSLSVETLDNSALEQSLGEDQDLITAYKYVISKQPHTRFQRFRKGLQWVFSLGAQKSSTKSPLKSTP